MAKTKFQMVEEFNNAVVHLQKVYPAHTLSAERINWYKNVLQEEALEFQDASKQKDCVGMLDALVDAAYYIIGRVQECGFTEFQWNKAFEYVHIKNMQKHSGNKGRGSDMDAVKDASWTGPETLINRMLQATGYYRTTTQSAKTKIETETEPKALEPIELKKPQKIDKHEPSVYIDNNGEQLICTVEDLKLFKQMSPVFKEVTEIAIKKSEDYNNGKSCPDSRAKYFPFGLLSYAQMLHIKSQRLNSLVQQNKKPNNESIRDTLLDLINYAAFAVEAINKGEI